MYKRLKISKSNSYIFHLISAKLYDKYPRNGVTLVVTFIGDLSNIKKKT